MSLISTVLAQLCLISFFVAAGFSMIGPILPVYVKELGASTLDVGIMVSGFAMARMILNIPTGLWIQRVEPKKVLILGLLIVASSSAAVGLLTDARLIILARVLGGFGSAFYLTTSMSILASVTTGQARGRSLSLYDTASKVGLIGGPTIGGSLAFLGGKNLPFFLYASFLAVSATIAFFSLRRIELKPASRSSLSSATLRNLYRDRSFLLVNAATFGYFFVLNGLNLALLPLFAAENLRLDPLRIGAAFTIFGVCHSITLFLSGALSDDYGRKPFMICGFLLVALVITILPLASNTTQFTLLMAAYGAAMGLTGPIAAWISDLAPSDTLGVAMGAYRTLNDIGVILGSLVLAYISQTTGRVGFLPFLLSAMLLTGLAVSLRHAVDPSRLRLKTLRGFG